MDNLEKVEKLREKTGVSYEEAKAALEATNYDVLDATSTEFEQAQQEYTRDCNKKTFGQMMDQFFSWCGKLLKKSVDSKFIIERRGSTMVNVPVLVLILAIVFAFWITIPLLVVGLFCECRYHFAGIDNINVDLNSACDKVADTVETIKTDINKN